MSDCITFNMVWVEHNSLWYVIYVVIGIVLKIIWDNLYIRLKRGENK